MFKTVSQCFWQGIAIGIVLGLFFFAGTGVAIGVGVLFGLVWFALHWIEKNATFSSVEEEVSVPTDEERALARKQYYQILVPILVLILAIVVYR